MTQYILRSQGNHPRSYRDVLARKGYQPLRIERTMKRGQDLVLLPVAGIETVPGRKGQFAGYCVRKAVGL